MSIEDLFKNNSLKATNQRKIVVKIVEELGDRATAKNVAEKCEKEVDCSTVYRIIDLFVEKGVFEKNLNYNNEIYYSIKEEHGHYIRCIKCHKKEKIDECPLDIIEKKLEDEGYKVLNHTIQLDGICKECLTQKK